MASHFFTFIFAIALILLVHGNIVNGSTNNIVKGEEDPDISYSGGHGPDKWGSIHQSFVKCGTGQNQSPIDIEVDKVFINRNLDPLSTHYFSTNATLINHRYFVELHLGGKGNFHVNDKVYTLKQIHWHAPSEHKINGVQYDAEGHLVHVAPDDSKAVIGILYKIGKPDPFLSKFQDKFVKLANGHDEIIDIGMVKPPKVGGKFYRYMGSLTTPPCLEDITWTLLTKERTISKQQIDILKGPLDKDCKSNFRPVQPLNGRHVEIH